VLKKLDLPQPNRGLFFGFVASETPSGFFGKYAPFGSLFDDHI
jgi:hypothetical protein